MSVPPDYDDEEPDPRPLAEERAVLGRMLLSRDAVTTAASVLRPEHFSYPAHRDVFETILELVERGDPTDEIAVAAALSGQRIVRVGGPLAIHALVEDVTTAVNVGYYAELVRDRARRVEAVEVLSRAARIAVEGDATQTAANFAAIRDLVEAVTTDRDPVGDDADGAWVAEVIDDELDAWEQPEVAGLLTGSSDFDELVGGLRPGQLVIIAARPGVGKSILASDWGRYAAEHGAAVLHFSLEMSRRELMQRLIAAKAKVRLRDITQRTWTDHERGLMTAAARELRETVFRIEDGPNASMAQIRAKARAMARSSTGLDLLIVDYLQLMTSSGRRVESRQQEVSDLSRGLKILAKELDIPIVAIAQLNRGPEQRSDHRPMLSDLRESGSLEQDSDLVVLINRPDAWERDDPRAGEADLILAKHRNGPTATITVAHQLHYARFADIARGTP